MTRRPVGRALACLAGAAVLAHAAPALTALEPVRRLGWPALSGAGDPTRVALTFDDGPDPASTPAFMRALADLEVSATFFLLGRMLSRAPWLGRELVEAGHEVALHGWGHRVLLARGPAGTVEDLARGHDEVVHACGVAPAFYRPPYGVLSWPAFRAAAALGMTPVLWTTWGRDWRATATATTITADVGRRLTPGATVLLHDSDCTSTPGSWRATLAALPMLVGQIREAGLVPGTLREHGLPRQPGPSNTGSVR